MRVPVGSLANRTLALPPGPLLLGLQLDLYATPHGCVTGQLGHHGGGGGTSRVWLAGSPCLLVCLSGVLLAASARSSITRTRPTTSPPPTRGAAGGACTASCRCTWTASWQGPVCPSPSSTQVHTLAPLPPFTTLHMESRDGVCVWLTHAMLSCMACCCQAGWLPRYGVL